MACQFFEVLDLADLIHLIDDPVQYGFNLLVCLFLKERALAFQPTLVPQEFFFVESGDLLFFARREFHDGRTITLPRSACKPLFEHVIDGLGIRAATCHDSFSARQCVEDDNCNVMCLGARVVGPELAVELVKIYVAARFSGAERHRRRLAKVANFEERFNSQTP